MRLPLLLLLLFAALGAAPAAAQATHVVNATGSGDFVFLQDAIDYAVDGETLLIESTVMPTWTFVVDGKDVDLVGLRDPAGMLPQLRRVELRNLPAGSNCVVRSLVMESFSATSCAGGVQLERLQVGGFVAHTELTDCRSARIIDCHFAPDETDALFVSNSTVHITGSTLLGGIGWWSMPGGLCSTCCTPSGDGFSAVTALHSSRVLIESSQTTGGLPGFDPHGCGTGTMGRAIVRDWSSEVRYRGASLPTPISTPLVHLIEPARDLLVAPAVVERDFARLEVQGQPGETAVLLLGNEAATTDMGGEVGMVHVANTAARRLLGQIPASGTLTFDVLTPEVPVGEARPFLLQVALLTPAGVRFTPARTVHVVDAAVQVWD